MRSFLVYPTFAVYPQLMPQVQLFDALHRGHEAVMQKRRLKFFWIIFIAIFVWEWFPVRQNLRIFSPVPYSPSPKGIHCTVSRKFQQLCAF